MHFLNDNISHTKQHTKCTPGIKQTGYSVSFGYCKFFTLTQQQHGVPPKNTMVLGLSPMVNRTKVRMKHSLH